MQDSVQLFRTANICKATKENIKNAIPKLKGTMVGWQDGWMDGWMDGMRVDGWMDGWMGGWMDG